MNIIYTERTVLLKGFTKRSKILALYIGYVSEK